MSLNRKDYGISEAVLDCPSILLASTVVLLLSVVIGCASCTWDLGIVD